MQSLSGFYHEKKSLKMLKWKTVKWFQNTEQKKQPNRLTLCLLKFFHSCNSSTAVITVQTERFLNSFPLLYKGNKDHYNHQIHCLMYEHRGHKKAGGFLIKLLASGQSLFDVYISNPFKNCTPEHNLRTKHFIPSVIRTVYFLL